MTRFLFLVSLYLLFFSYEATAQNEPLEWWKIDRIGLGETGQNSFLSDNIWEDYTQSEAIEALSRLPHILAEAEYRALVRDLLLSESRPLREEVDSPYLLAKRLNLLIRYGFVDEARNVLTTLDDEYDLNTSMDLSLVRLKLSLLEGDLAPVCLDIQAASAQFRDMPAWRELVDFCRYRFESAPPIQLSELEFESYPNLKFILGGTLSYVADLNDFELLLAHADDKLLNDEAYKLHAREVKNLPDLLVNLASSEKYNKHDAYHCYVIEAVKRGLRDTDFLTVRYQNAIFEEQILDDDSGQVTLHPCSVPAFFYQKILTAETDFNRSNFLNAMLMATETMPLAALTPFSEFIQETPINDSHKWRAAAVIGESHSNIPESLLPAAQPLHALISGKPIEESEYIDWANIDSHENILEQNHIDIAAPLYFLQILNDEINKLGSKTRINKYENIFSLTYEKKSLNLGIGFTGFMSALLDNRDPVAVITRLLNLTANNAIQDYSTEDAAVILSVFKAYKLEKEYVMLALEYLQ